jgi:hypothetical protein
LASSPEVIGFETEWIFPGALATRLLGLKLPSGTSTIAIVVVCGRYAKFVVLASPPARIEKSSRKGGVTVQKPDNSVFHYSSRASVFRDNEPRTGAAIAIVVVCGRYAKFVVTASPPARIEVSAVSAVSFILILEINYVICDDFARLPGGRTDDPRTRAAITIKAGCGRYAKFVVIASPPARIEVSAVPTIAILNSVRPSVN